MSILEGGSVLTNDRIIYFWSDENDKLYSIQKHFKEIETVKLEKLGDFLDDSIYAVYTKNNSDAAMRLFLSTTNGDDKKFVNSLKEQISSK